MTKAIAIEIFQVSISYRVLPSRKGATHRQLSIEKNYTSNADMGYTRANYLIGRYIRGTQREYSSKPHKHSIVERTLVFKR